MDYSHLVGKKFKLKVDNKKIEKVVRVENTADAGTIVIFESAERILEESNVIMYISILSFLDFYEPL